MHVSPQVMGWIIVPPEGPEHSTSSLGISLPSETASVQGDSFPDSSTGMPHSSHQRTCQQFMEGKALQATNFMTHCDWQCLSRGPSNSPQRETGTCKSQSKKLISWYIPQKQTLTPFILSARLCFWPAFFVFFFSYFHLPFFKKTVNKGISSICSHSFSICTKCLCCYRVSVSMQLNPKTTCRTFAAQVGWWGTQPLERVHIP